MLQGVNVGELFGPGDVVGCGLLYPFEDNIDGAIFFTKNGRHLISIAIDAEYFNVEWFPMIGIDSFSPVEVNFGEHPFLYRDVEASLTSLDEQDFAKPSILNQLMIYPHERVPLKEGTSTFFSAEKRRACEVMYDMYMEHGSVSDDGDDDFDDYDLDISSAGFSDNSEEEGFESDDGLY